MRSSQSNTSLSSSQNLEVLSSDEQSSAKQDPVESSKLHSDRQDSQKQTSLIKTTAERIFGNNNSSRGAQAEKDEKIEDLKATILEYKKQAEKFQELLEQSQQEIHNRDKAMATVLENLHKTHQNYQQNLQDKDTIQSKLLNQIMELQIQNSQTLRDQNVLQQRVIELEKVQAQQAAAVQESQQKASEAQERAAKLEARLAVANQQAENQKARSPFMQEHYYQPPTRRSAPLDNTPMKSSYSSADSSYDVREGIKQTYSFSHLVGTLDLLTTKETNRNFVIGRCRDLISQGTLQQDFFKMPEQQIFLAIFSPSFRERRKANQISFDLVKDNINAATNLGELARSFCAEASTNLANNIDLLEEILRNPAEMTRLKTSNQPAPNARVVGASQMLPPPSNYKA